jgi:hypothetical protein
MGNLARRMGAGLRFRPSPDHSGVGDILVRSLEFIMSAEIGPSDTFEPKRLVSLRRDDSDYVVVLQPDNVIAFRSPDAAALRRVCRFLRWKIVSDTALLANDL